LDNTPLQVIFLGEYELERSPRIYRAPADSRALYDNSGPTRREPRQVSFAAGVGRALRRAAKDARKTARMYGTPL
jgi:hypothetical protein